MRMKRLYPVLGIVAMVLLSGADAIAIESVAKSSGGDTKVYVEYILEEVKRNDLEEHRILTQFSIDAGRNISYDYSDWITGSKAKTAISTKFHRGYGITLSDDEAKQLVQQLQRLRLFDWKTDSEPLVPSPYSEDILLEIEGKEVRLSFHTPSQSPERLALKNALMDVVRRNGLDQPEDRGQAIITTEGDFEEARQVSLEQLVGKHEQYHGKRVSVVGFFDGTYPEQQELFVNEDAAKNRLVEKSIWRGAQSTFANLSSIKDRKKTWFRVEGVFLWGYYGHKGGLQGMIDRVTKLEVLHTSLP